MLNPLTPLSVASRMANWYLAPKPDITYLLLSVTFQCNSRCVMCNIWKGIHDRDEMTLEEYAHLSRDRGLRHLREFDLTGGETFMRRDLTEIIRLFVDTHALACINVPTNGFLTDRIVAWYHDVRTFYDGLLRVGLSIDGYGATHDHVRQVPHAWDRAVETWNELKELMKRDRRFEASVMATIIGDVNVDDIPRLADTFGERFMFRLSCTNSYLGNDHAWIEHTPEIVHKYAAYSQRYCTDNNLRYVQPKLVSYFADHPYQFIPCRLAVNRHVFIQPNGDVYPCVESWGNCYLGNVRDASLDAILHSTQADAARRFIRRGGCYCIADCMYLRNLKLDPRYYVWRLKDRLGLAETGSSNSITPKGKLPT